MSEARRLIDAATLARDRVVRAVEQLSPAQAAFKPAPYEWSITENVEHLAIVEVRYANRIWAAADGVRTGRPLWPGEPIHRGRTIEELAAAWGPNLQTVDEARPRLGGPLDFWVAALRNGAGLIAALEPVLDGLDLGAVIVPHVTGPLDARQRLGLVRLHLEMHLVQIQGVQAAPGYPAASRTW
jgi:DinB superfamily